MLTDTNIGLRWLDLGTPASALVAAAIRDLEIRGHELRMCAQNYVEFWATATRPVHANGLGLDAAGADHLLKQVEAAFPLLDDPPSLYAEWRRLVLAHDVSGRQVYDARLAAFMLVHGITHILTFNIADFARYSGVVAVHPNDAATVP